MLYDISNQCRNKELQSLPWLPTFTIYFSPLLRFFNPEDPQSLQLVSYSDSVEVSASDLTLQSEFSYDDQVYTHTFTCVFYNSSTDTLSWLQSLISDLKKPSLLTPVIKLSTSSQDSIIQVSSLTSSLTHDPSTQSISLTLSTVSDFPLKQLISYSPVPPPVEYLYIRGTLESAYIIPNSGFTYNDIPVRYSDLTLTGNSFTIPVPADTILTSFNAEWLYGSQSPLIGLDLSDFEGHESLTDLSTAFKGNQNLQDVILPSCSNVTTYEECFRDCSHLVNFSGPQSFNGVTTFKRCFQNCTSLQSFSFGSWNIQSDPDCSYMFTGCTSLTSVDVDKLATVSKIDFMFAACNHLTRMNLYSKVWYVTSAENTFAQCTGLEYLSLWGMDPLQEHPGQFQSNNFFPSGAVNLVVDFHASHAHGYDITTLNNQSLSNYLHVLANIPASFAGNNKDVTLTDAQDLHIQSDPLLLQAKTDAQAQGWMFWYV